MSELELPYPRFIDYAVAGNRHCGVCPQNVPEDLKQYCDGMTASPQRYHKGCADRIQERNARPRLLINYRDA